MLKLTKEQKAEIKLLKALYGDQYNEIILYYPTITNIELLDGYFTTFWYNFKG